MNINPNNIELIISAVQEAQYPETNLSEVALSGRSNVGKSTFINSMIGRKNMARTSQQPGIYFYISHFSKNLLILRFTLL